MENIFADACGIFLLTRSVVCVNLVVTWTRGVEA